MVFAFGAYAERFVNGKIIIITYRFSFEAVINFLDDSDEVSVDFIQISLKVLFNQTEKHEFITRKWNKMFKWKFKNSLHFLDSSHFDSKLICSLMKYVALRNKYIVSIIQK